MTEVNPQTFRLDVGSHHKPEAGMCVMEAVAFINREEFSDAPACADLWLSYMLQGMNDGATDEQRQQLIPLIPRIVESKGKINGRAATKRLSRMIQDHARKGREGWPETTDSLFSVMGQYLREKMDPAMEESYLGEIGMGAALALRPKQPSIHKDKQADGSVVLTEDWRRVTYPDATWDAIIGFLDAILPPDEFAIPADFAEIKAAVAEAKSGSPRAECATC